MPKDKHGLKQMVGVKYSYIQKREHQGDAV